MEVLTGDLLLNSDRLALFCFNDHAFFARPPFDFRQA